MEIPLHRGIKGEGGRAGQVAGTHMLPPTSFLLVFYGFSSGCLTFYVTAINFQWHCRFILHTGEWLARRCPPAPLHTTAHSRHQHVAVWYVLVLLTRF